MGRNPGKLQRCTDEAAKTNALGSCAEEDCTGAEGDMAKVKALDQERRSTLQPNEPISESVARIVVEHLRKGCARGFILGKLNLPPVDLSAHCDTTANPAEP
jgi:hypothetical protein